MPNLKVNKWDKYSEAFCLIDNKLYKKGGIFSEYIKMNRLGFQMIEKERKDKLKNKIKNILKKKNKNKNVKNIHPCFSDGSLKITKPKIKKLKVI